MTRAGLRMAQVASSMIGCYETVENGGACVDAIETEFGNMLHEPWCAMFVWVVANRVANEMGQPNPLPHTASAIGMLRGAQQSEAVPVNKQPAVGACMYRKSAGATGHWGVVAEIRPATITNVEGNAGDRVKAVSYGADYLNDPSHGVYFVHTELMAGSDQLNNPAPSVTEAPRGASLPILAIALGAVIFLYTWG